jgi:ABC-type spermidine/putrescine transport system permease subunit II
MEGLNGVIFVQSIHYFPFILINLSAALRNIDRSMEEAAQNLGAPACACSAASCFRSPCPATSPARRWCS